MTTDPSTRSHPPFQYTGKLASKAPEAMTLDKS
jgi:hypothetical protein